MMDLNNPTEWEDMETQQAESAEELERYRRFTPVNERDDLERAKAICDEIDAEFERYWAECPFDRDLDKYIARISFRCGATAAMRIMDGRR